jgi:Fic family protein
MFPFDDAPLREAQLELDRWRDRLDRRGVLPRGWFGRLRRDLEAEAVAASTSMEGVPVTVEEVRRILVGDRPTAVRREDAALVEGYRNAMSFVLRRADAPEFHWDAELIIALHDHILAGNWAAGAGRFRSGATFIVNSRSGEVVFEPPDPQQVPELVRETCAAMEDSRWHPAIGAAWMHLALAAIHPFQDGNGRTARIVASLVMYRGGYRLPEFTSLEEWWGRHLDDYYSAFRVLGQTFDADRDVSSFLVAHVEAQLHQVRALDLRERVQRQIWLAVEQSVLDAGMEARVANATWDAFFSREVTPRYYRPLAEISAATATNDLKSAVAAGLLRPQGNGRSRSYLAGPKLYSSVAGQLGVARRGSTDADADSTFIIGELTKRMAAEPSPIPISAT